MNIYDTINKIWTIGSSGGLLGRYGHTATFLPDTGEIIYIGGIAEYGLIYTTYVRKNIIILFKFFIFKTNK